MTIRVTLSIAAVFLLCETASMRQPAPVGIAEVNGTRLYYERAGSGPHVVLLHGANLDSRM